jgi:hypothetical protein
MQEVCSVIDPLIKTESMMPLQTVILTNQQMNPNNGPPMQNGQSHLNMHNQQQIQAKLNPNCDNKPRVPDNSYWMPAESGFINSQPTMAEFLTHIGPDSSPKMDQSAYGNSSEDPVPEYPWMKEKKTARKNQSQSEFEQFSQTYIIIINFLLMK